MDTKVYQYTNIYQSIPIYTNQFVDTSSFSIVTSHRQKTWQTPYKNGTCSYYPYTIVTYYTRIIVTHCTHFIVTILPLNTSPLRWSFVGNKSAPGQIHLLEPGSCILLQASGFKAMPVLINDQSEKCIITDMSFRFHLAWAPRPLANWNTDILSAFSVLFSACYCAL